MENITIVRFQTAGVGVAGESEAIDAEEEVCHEGHRGDDGVWTNVKIREDADDVVGQGSEDDAIVGLDIDSVVVASVESDVSGHVEFCDQVIGG
jgi:hypothetical protein